MVRGLVISGLSLVSMVGCGQMAPAASAPVDAKQVVAMQTKLSDWPQLGRYAGENAALAPPAKGEKRVVFYGDSITDAWGRRDGTGDFFPGRPYVNRGISGQTTAQMVVRFEQDVVHLKPAAVVILAGTNDIAGNTGPMTTEMTQDNFEAMVAIAKQNGIKVVITSITPAAAFPWRTSVTGVADSVRADNAMLKALCAREGLVYVDYYSALANAQGGFDADLSFDGVHPREKAYAVMAPLAQAGIDKALGQ